MKILTNYSYMLKKDLKGLLSVLITDLPKFYVAGPKDESFYLKIILPQDKKFENVFSLLHAPFNLSKHNIYALFLKIEAVF